ncbi:MAG: protein-tyrosine-phosphatase [Gammaproteobacteria bacterium]|nr:protein-tyrosine-phosphatase [Gammaproteobacteria bacterium]
MKLSTIVLLLLLITPGLSDARAKKIDDYHWVGVKRVIAIGDLHGDYGRYIDVMESAGLINKSGKWIGGKTHFVQTGDITDRGADSRKIIDHLVKLAKQAKRKGGYVHLLIGNHETMNVVGDLRYVSDGEFQAFVTKNSPRLQNMQWDRQVEWMQANMPDFENMDLKAYRLEWEKTVPLGWVEHRRAWALSGQYGKWVKGNQVAIQINDTIFLHGGISEKYCKFSLQSLTEQVIAVMENYDPSITTIMDDPMGPVWYRGLAREDESNDIFSQTLDNILNRYGAKRIVIGHTPTGGVVWPRFDQRVVANDTGIAAHYGSHKGLLELTSKGVTAIYGDKRIPLPTRNDEREDYLRAVIEVDSNNGQLKQRLTRMLTPPVEAPVETTNGDDAGSTEDGGETAVLPLPSPGTCQ